MTEVLQGRPEINWAKMVADPVNGDPISGGFGITKIGIGNRMYLAEFNGIDRAISERAFDRFEPTDSRIYIGHPDWTRSFLRVNFDPEKPISLFDVDRINHAARLAVDLFRVETAQRTSDEVGTLANQFEQVMKKVLQSEKVDIFGTIAIAIDKLREYSGKDFPAEFLSIADQMDALGIEEICPGQIGQRHINFWTPDYLREKFGRASEGNNKTFTQ